MATVRLFYELFYNITQHVIK